VCGVSDAGQACPVLCSRLPGQGAAQRDRTGGAIHGSAQKDAHTRS
jgi:hypothetical protein